MTVAINSRWILQSTLARELKMSIYCPIMGLICILQPSAPSTLGHGAAAIWVLCQMHKNRKCVCEILLWSGLGTVAVVVHL